MRALSTLALVALLSSCAALPAPPTAGLDPAQYDGRPLRARIVNGSGQLMVNTNRPAHVAIFEIVPGRGVGLLYPAYRGERNFLSSGLNSIFLTRSRNYYPYFQPAPFFASSASREGPRYLYMIASDAPLQLGSFLGSPGALRRELGLTRFASGNPYGLMEDLADLVLPYGTAGDWTDDVYAVWPDRSYGGDYEAGQWIRVQCADGRIIEGPAYYVYGACARANDAPPLEQAPAQPDDSISVKEPTRRRPEPREPGTEEATPTAPPPVVVERLPEPEPARRPGVRVQERLTDGQTARTPWDRRDDSPRVERRSEPGSRETESRPAPRESRPEPSEPRVERAEPRSEPPPAPPIETPQESPRVETSRPEPRSSEPPARR